MLKKLKEIVTTNSKGIKYKQSEFLSLLKNGKSISNIKTYNNWTSDDLLEIVTDNFIIECNKIDPQFGKTWERWKEKYL